MSIGNHNYVLWSKSTEDSMKNYLIAVVWMRSHFIVFFFFEATPAPLA